MFPIKWIFLSKISVLVIQVIIIIVTAPVSAQFPRTSCDTHTLSIDFQKTNFHNRKSMNAA